MTSDEKKTRQTDAQDKVINSNENQIEITVEQLKNFTGELIQPKFKIVLAIIMAQIASGCRLIEILSSEFEFSESKKDGYIIQNNVAKNKTDAERPVEKPVLFIEVGVFLKIMQFIRAKMTVKEGDTNIQLSNRYGKRVNVKIVKI